MMMCRNSAIHRDPINLNREFRVAVRGYVQTRRATLGSTHPDALPATRDTCHAQGEDPEQKRAVHGPWGNRNLFPAERIYPSLTPCSRRSPSRSSSPATARLPCARAGRSDGTWSRPCWCAASVGWRGRCPTRCYFDTAITIQRVNLFTGSSGRNTHKSAIHVRESRMSGQLSGSFCEVHGTDLVAMDPLGEPFPVSVSCQCRPA